MRPVMTTARPYARMRIPEISVTTAIAAKAIDGLPWGASKETALYAVHHADEWQSLDPAEAVDVLRKHHRGVWDGRAAMGTLVHSVNDRWTRSLDVDLDEMVRKLSEKDRQAKSWVGREDAVVEQALGYVDGLERFWTVHRPKTLGAEDVVRLPGVYIGTRDWLARMLDTGTGEVSRWLLDIKTTAEQDGEKGVYHDSWALQLAAYDRAPEIVHYVWPNGKPQESGTAPNERADHCGIVHLRGDGDFSLYEVDASDETYGQFLSLCLLAQWTKALKPPRLVKPPKDREVAA